MKILRLKLFQESACFKKPFSLKVSETYPLPPYSTIIGMFHKILEAKSGEFYPMEISIQGDYGSIFNNYQTLLSYKKNEITSMPRNINMLHDVHLIIHVKAEDEIIDKLYDNIVDGKTPIVIGRNEDFARLDEISYVKEEKKVKNKVAENNIYVPSYYEIEDLSGIHYILNTKYKITKDGLRKWNKVDVIYAQKGSWIIPALCDEEDYVMVFCKVGE